jgi:hypothetical protein
MKLNLNQIALTGQGIYYTVTGLWPIFSISTFEMITGPKTDHWLVRMVGLLAAAIGITLLFGARSRAASNEIFLLAVSSAVAFAAIDIFYSLSGIISPIYLADSVLQAIIIALHVRGIIVRKEEV